MSGEKFEIEKFNGRNNFRLWIMHALLTTQVLANKLDGKTKLSEMMKEANEVELMEKAKSVILFNLSDEVLIEVAEKKYVTML